MKRIIFGHKVELDLSMPAGTIKMHPDTFLDIENQGIDVDAVIINEIKREPILGH